MAKLVMFVCTGNSCRSVMAQGLLQSALKQMESRLREPIEVDSAGMFAIEGMTPSKETLKLLQQEGIDMSGHLAKLLGDHLIRQSDLILVMEQFHRDEILRRAPEAAGKVHLLKVYGVGDPSQVSDPNIHDPIGKPMEVYEVCFAAIRESVERTARLLVDSQAG